MPQKYHWRCESGDNHEFFIVAVALLTPFLLNLAILSTLLFS